MSASRNAPCPCGSGRKYKHCHGATAARPLKSRPGEKGSSLDRARELLQRGYLPEAEMLCLEVLARSARNADAMNLLGVLHAQRGDQASALGWLGKAVAIDSQSAAYRLNFGKVLLQLGRAREACESLERATALDPGKADAHNELGLARAQAGFLEAAEGAFRKALSLQPGYWEAYNNLGLFLQRIGRAEEAVATLRKALELEPRSPDVLTNLGMALRAQRLAEESVQAYRAALALRPGDPGTLTNLGNALVDLSRNEEAIDCFRAALASSPRYAAAYYNWGSLQLRLGRFGEAASQFRAALEIEPHLADAECGLASALRDSGHVDESIAACRRVLDLNPDNAEVHSQLLFSLLHSSTVTPLQVFDEHREWARRHAGGASHGPAKHANGREPERRLRIGYVSGDFRQHPVAQFLEPVLERHDRTEFEILCYYNVPHADAMTDRLRLRADGWRDIASLGDDEVAERIRNDRIDVLVDLSGHTGFNRLLVFARKPAPVQASWLGYLGTTGLDAIGYRITDGRATPREFDALHTERVVRLPDSQWCYRPPVDCPDVAVPPSVRESKPVTLGAFSSLAKIGPRVIATWSKLLERLSGGRLLIAGLGLDSMREEYLSRFAAAGVAPHRIELRGFQSFADYLAMHQDVDLILDTFPYSGGTTTCHALWMGVPVVTLTGDSYPSRGGASVLGALGLGELVAETPEQYVDEVCALAIEPARLSQLRSSMRARMSSSALMDAARFTSSLEHAYRSMWRDWCQNPGLGEKTDASG